MAPRILLTGATGNVGTHLTRELVTRGVSVRAFVRDSGRARERFGALADDRLEIVTGDFEDGSSLRRALDGVSAVFLACGNHPRQAEYEAAAIDAAAAAGVRRIVKLSALGAEVGSPVAFWDMHGQIERHLHTSRVPAVVLRPSFYMTNLLAAADSVRRQGLIVAPAAGARIAMIDPRDIAAVAALALADDRHDGQTYELTGPEAITYERVAEALSTAGRRVEFVDVPDDAARHGLVAAGIPPWFAENLVIVFGLLRRGAAARTSEELTRLTGRAARTFADFARDHAAFFAGPDVLPAAARLTH